MFAGGHKIILSIEGEVATGKSTIAYTSPKKVVGFSFDLGADRAIYGMKFDQYFAESKVEVTKYRQPGANHRTQQEQFKNEVLLRWCNDCDIQVFEFPQPVQLDTHRVLGGWELWATALVLLGKCIEDEAVRTVVVDTATIARRVKADAYLQELQEKQLVDSKGDTSKLRKQLIAIEWGHPNDFMRSLYTLFQGIGKNLVVIHHLQDERRDFVQPNGTVENRATGVRELDGMNESARYWDVGIRTLKNPVTKELTATYVKCGYNLTLEGTPVPSLDWNGIIAPIVGSTGGRIKIERAEPQRLSGVADS